MSFVPAARFVIDVDAAPDEVRDRLASAVVAVVPRGRLSFRGPDGPFIGTVGASSFDLRPVLGYRNSFAPTVRGAFATGIAGTRIDVRLRMLPAVAVFMLFWLSFAAAFLVAMLVIAVRNPSRSWLPLIGLAFFAFGYLLMAFSFSFEARRIRTKLTLLVTGTPAADLPRTDLSWLTDLRLPNAEPPERRFNRLFLATHGVCGALVLLTWFRTGGACSNYQYHHRSEYSCPSDTRIVATWLLAVALIATGFASRVVLHKRLRAAYVPVLLLLGAIGVAAAWSLTHHPHWGIPR